MSDSISNVPNLVPYPTWSQGLILLGNAEDEILILDEQDKVVDVVAYGLSEYPYFQPPVMIETSLPGYSIERFPADQDTDTASDWIVQLSPNPGS